MYTLEMMRFTLNERRKAEQSFSIESREDGCYNATTNCKFLQVVHSCESNGSNTVCSIHIIHSKMWSLHAIWTLHSHVSLVLVHVYNGEIVGSDMCFTLWASVKHIWCKRNIRKNTWLVESIFNVVVGLKTVLVVIPLNNRINEFKSSISLHSSALLEL